MVKDIILLSDASRSTDANANKLLFARLLPIHYKCGESFVRLTKSIIVID